MTYITGLIGCTKTYTAEVEAFASERDILPDYIEANCERVNRWEGKPAHGWLIGKKSTTQQFKPDEPDINDKGKLIKYKSPTGRTPGLFTPAIPEGRDNPFSTTYLIITEGLLKAIKSASVGLPCVAVTGVWNGRIRDKDQRVVLIKEIEDVILHGFKLIIIAFDADCASNPNVHKASIELAKLITDAGAECKIATGTWQPSEGKGMDDFISKNGVEEMRARLERALSLDEYVEKYTPQKSSNAKPDAGELAVTLAEMMQGKLAYNPSIGQWLTYEKIAIGAWGESTEAECEALVYEGILDICNVKVSQRIVRETLGTMKYRLMWKDVTPVTGTPFRNGVLVDGKLQPHSPDNRLMWTLPRDYDDKAKDWGRIQDFISMATECDEDAKKLYCFAAALLQGTRNLQKYLHLIGKPGSGKGTYTNLLSALIGKENCKNSTLSAFCGNNFESAGAYGKRLLLFRDEGKHTGALQNFLNATGGEPIRYEKKGKDATDFLFEGLALLSSNDPVFFGDNQRAVQRRESIVIFNKPPGIANTGLLDEMVEQLPAWTNYLLSIPEDEIKSVLLSKSERGALLQWQMRVETDALAAWVDDHLMKASSEAYVRVGADKNEIKAVQSILQCDTLYGSYSAYCDQTHRNALSNKAFITKLAEMLEAIGWTTRKGKDAKGAKLFGVRLRREYDPVTGYDNPVMGSDGFSDGLNPCHTTIVTGVTGFDQSITHTDTSHTNAQAKDVDNSLSHRTSKNPSHPSLSLQGKDCNPSPTRHQPVTEPSQPVTVDVQHGESTIKWEVFQPQPGDKVEFIVSTGGYQSGDVAVVDAVNGETVHFYKDEKNVRTNKVERVKKSVQKFYLRLSD